MSKFLAFLCVLAFALSTIALAQDAPATDCDTYAASNDDPQRKTAGIPLGAVNPALAVPACEAAVRQYPNSSRLAFQLGRAFTMADNFAAAVLQYRKAADQGYAIAQNNLGSMYENGKGVAKDYAQAVVWYRKAAEQGFEPAQANVRRLSSQDTAAATGLKSPLSSQDTAAATGLKSPLHYAKLAIMACFSSRSGLYFECSYTTKSCMRGYIGNWGFVGVIVDDADRKSVLRHVALYDKSYGGAELDFDTGTLTSPYNRNESFPSDESLAEIERLWSGYVRVKCSGLPAAVDLPPDVAAKLQ